MEKEEAKKVLKSSWVMTTGHTLDKNNAELKEAIETILNQEEEECLHCGKGKASYCENCYQELIGINAKLQNENKELKEIRDTKLDKYLHNNLWICKDLAENYIHKPVIEKKASRSGSKTKNTYGSRSKRKT